MDKTQKTEALALREQGMTIVEIADSLGIGKSLAGRLVRGVKRGKSERQSGFSPQSPPPGLVGFPVPTTPDTPKARSERADLLMEKCRPLFRLLVQKGVRKGLNFFLEVLRDRFARMDPEMDHLVKVEVSTIQGILQDCWIQTGMGSAHPEIVGFGVQPRPGGRIHLLLYVTVAWWTWRTGASPRRVDACELSPDGKVSICGVTYSPKPAAIQKELEGDCEIERSRGMKKACEVARKML